MLTSSSPEQPILGSAHSPLAKALAKPTIDISPSTPLSRNSPTLERVNRLLSRTSRKVTPSTPSTPSLPITPMARLGVSATPRTSRPTPRSPRASRSLDQIAMLRRTSITKAATPAAAATPASVIDSPRRSQEIQSLCRRIAFKQNAFQISSRAINNINNDTMRDLMQDLKERSREERVRNFTYERKQEREKRWYRIRGIRMPCENVSWAADNGSTQAGPLHSLINLAPTAQGRAPLTRQPTLQDVCLSFKPDDQYNERRGSWHIQARKERKEQERYRLEKLKWYKNARIALLTDNTFEMLQPGPNAVFVTDISSFSPINRCNECYSDDCLHQFEKLATYRGKVNILARRSANRKAQLKINTRKPSLEFTEWANRGKRWGHLRLESFFNIGKAARGWEFLKRRQITTHLAEKRRSSGNFEKQSQQLNNDLDLEIDLDQTVLLAPSDSTKHRPSKKHNGRITPMEDGTAGNPMDSILVVSQTDSNSVCSGAIITIQTIGQVLQNKALKSIFYMANEAVRNAPKTNKTNTDTSLAASLDDYLSIDIFCDEAMNVKGVLEYIFLQRYLCIYRIVIPEKYQRHGVGSTMMKRMLLLAKWRHKDLLVYAHPDTVPIYTKWGYEIWNDMEADDESVIMIKRVAAPERAESYGFSLGKCNTLLDS